MGGPRGQPPAGCRPALSTRSHCEPFRPPVAVLSHGSALLALVALVCVAWGPVASLQEHPE